MSCSFLQNCCLPGIHVLSECYRTYSQAFPASLHASKAPLPASFPKDQMMMLGKFLSLSSVLSSSRTKGLSEAKQGVPYVLRPCFNFKSKTGDTDAKLQST